MIPMLKMQPMKTGLARVEVLGRIGQMLALATCPTVFFANAHAEDHGPDRMGGGEYAWAQRVPHLSEVQRAEIELSLSASRVRLEKAGALAEKTSAEPADRPGFIWPVRAAAGVADPGVDAISGFVDHDFRYPELLEDYNCGNRTYDLASGYNHKGLDIFSWPFSWKKMDEDAVEVVAAAPGTILLKQDGNFDRSCGFNGGNWNAVYITHGDGSTAWYGHLKEGSLTNKAVGDTVKAGDYLGVMGSSGNSTGPHLHLEVYDSAGGLIDPFIGVCNGLNSESWWASQPEYRESRINAFTTGAAAAAFPVCPTAENPNIRSTFLTGDPAFFTTYYSDQLAGQWSDYRIIDPDGTTYYDWSHQSSDSYNASWWYWSWSSFASSGPTGIWTFQIDYDGLRYSRPFYVVSACPTNDTLPAQSVVFDTTLAAKSQLVIDPGVSVSSGARLTLLSGQSISLAESFSVGRGSSLRMAVGAQICD